MWFSANICQFSRTTETYSLSHLLNIFGVENISVSCCLLTHSEERYPFIVKMPFDVKFQFSVWPYKNTSYSKISTRSSFTFTFYLAKDKPYIFIFSAYSKNHCWSFPLLNSHCKLRPGFPRTFAFEMWTSRLF